MKAFRVLRYNKKNFADVRLVDVDTASLSPQQLRVRMRAAAFNPADLHTISGEMGMMSPVKPPFTLGVDGSGVVEALGSEVRDFQVGDEVFFYTGLVWSGTFAETVVVDARACAAKPAQWSYAQAAAAALALLCADLALERTQVHAGQQILIHGAGGSVGAAAVLLARQRGASVHATGSLDDKSFTEQLGAQAFYDYRQTPLQQLPRGKYDMVLDGMGERMFLESLPLLKEGGAIASLKVMTGMDDMLKMGMKPPGIFKYLLPFIMRKYTSAAKSAGVRVAGVATYQNGARLAVLGAQVAALGYLPRIDRSFALSQAPAALEHFVKGKPRGKVVLEM